MNASVRGATAYVISTKPANQSAHRAALTVSACVPTSANATSASWATTAALLVNAMVIRTVPDPTNYLSAWNAGTTREVLNAANA